MPTKIGKRIVVIGGKATRTRQPRRRAPLQGQRIGQHRLVIIKDGEVVRYSASR